MPVPTAAYGDSSCRGKWGVCVSIALVAACLTLLPEEWLRYQRQTAFSEGWRWLTAHLVHLGPVHLLVNVAGLLLVCELFWKALPVRHGVAAMLSAACVINLLLWFLHPDLQWYAGLSGLVHALWAACLSATLLQWQGTRSEQHWFALAGAALLLVKLLSERAGILVPALATDAFPVIHHAHSYGAFAGLAYILLWRASRSLCARK